MNKTFTKEALAGWINGLKQAAKEDEQFSVSWFIPTKESPLSIVGGWENGFSPREADLFCQSKSEPTFAMCIKIVVNEGPYAYCDFETLNMPVDDREEVEDTCIALEWKDDPTKVAEFYMMEWERLMDTLKE
jgi:hypothetical protein